jgi:hypothetical protein
MPNLDNPAEVKAFHDNVAHLVSRLNEAWTGGDLAAHRGHGMIAGRDDAIDETINQVFRDGTRKEVASKEELGKAALEAKAALHHPAARSALCSALKTATDGGFDITKLLLPLALSGAIAVSMTPLVFSLVCFTILRVGVSVFCAAEADASARK